MTSVTDPTAGADSGAIRALAARLQHVAATAGELQAEIGNTSATWTGRAATAFDGRLHELPGELGHMSSSFHEASGALLTWAADVDQLQHEARASMGAYSTATGHLLTLQHAPPPPKGAAPSASSIAAQHEAQAEAHNAQVHLNGIATEFASRARACKSRIDAAAPQVHRSTFSAILHYASATHGMAGVVSAVKDVETNGSRYIRALKGDAKAARKLGYSAWKASYRSTLKLKSGLEHKLDDVHKFGRALKVDGAAWKNTAGKSVIRITNKALKVAERPAVRKGLRVFGKAVNVVAAGIGVYTAVGDFRQHKIRDGIFASVGAVGAGVLVIGAGTVAGAIAVVGLPVEAGAVLVGAGVAIAADAVYENRKTLTAIGKAAKDEATEGVDKLRSDPSGSTNAATKRNTDLNRAWTEFSR